MIKSYFLTAAIFLSSSLAHALHFIGKEECISNILNESSQLSSTESLLLERISAPSALLGKPFDIKNMVESCNQSEIEMLWLDLKPLWEALSVEERKQLQDKVLAKLKEDKEKLSGIKAFLDSAGNIGSIPLRTSLVKLIGTEKGTGILDDAALYLEYSVPAFAGIEQKHFFDNEVTVLKTLLLYVNVLIRGKSHIDELGYDAFLQMVYPAQLPKIHPKELLQSLILVRERNPVSILLIPNAGYIYGGNPIKGDYRGIDCSAFIGLLFNIKSRVTTYMLELAWLGLRKAATCASENLSCDEADAEYEQKEIRHRFDAIESDDVKNLKANDVVVWRSPQAGHVAIVIEPIEGEHFIGIDVTRDDEKTKEGVKLGNYAFVRAGMTTYVLRPK